MKFYTYLYKDADGTPIYVGKGTKKRAWKHWSGDNHLGRTLRKRKEAGTILEPEIYEASNEAEAFACEVALIALYGRADLGTGTLYNLTDGGDGLTGASEDTRKKMSNKASNRPPITEETRKKLSVSLKGKNKGRKLGTTSLLQKTRASETFKGKPKSEEQKRKMSESNKGRIVTEEQRKKISNSQKIRLAKRKLENELK